MGICSVDGCGRDPFCGGLCSRHYNRLRTTGTTADGPRAKKPLAERFWAQVAVSGPDECWNWTAKSQIQGYGVIGLGGRDAGKILSHRAAWTLTYGPIPEGEGHHGTVVRHKCDNRLCCNPAHLELGSQADNVRDMDARKRRVNAPQHGAKHGNARFTEADVWRIRELEERSEDLAREYNTDRAVINNIRARRSWKHIP